MSERDVQRIRVLSEVLGGRRTVGSAATLLDVTPRLNLPRLSSGHSMKSESVGELPVETQENHPCIPDHEYVVINEAVRFRMPSHRIARPVFQRMAYSQEGRREMREFLDLSAGCNNLLDIGASGGFFSALFASSRTAANILSVEPDPASYRVLADTKSKNARPTVNWILDARAILDQTEYAPFVSTGYGGEIICQSVLRNALECAARNNVEAMFLEVPCTTLDDILSKHSLRPDLIKIDIESYEHELVTSSLDVLTRLRPKIMLELHIALLLARGHDPLHALTLLSSAGYRRLSCPDKHLSDLLREAGSAAVVRSALLCATT